MPASFRHVVPESSYRRGVQRNDTLRAELCAGNAQGAGGRIEITEVKAQCLADAHAGTRDQPKQSAVRDGTQRIGAVLYRQQRGPLQEDPDLSVGVDVRRAPPVGRSDQPRARYLCSRIKDRTEPGEAAEALQAFGVIEAPVRRVGERCPTEGEGPRQRLLWSRAIGVTGEGLDLRSLNAQLIPESPAVDEIASSKRHHRGAATVAHRGHGCARLRSASTSV